MHCPVEGNSLLFIKKSIVFLSRINSLSIFEFEAGCCGKKMLLFKLNNGPNCIVHRAGIVFCAEVVNTGQIMWSKMLNRIQALQAAISSHNASVTIKNSCMSGMDTHCKWVCYYQHWNCFKDVCFVKFCYGISYVYFEILVQIMWSKAKGRFYIFSERNLWEGYFKIYASGH